MAEKKVTPDTLEVGLDIERGTEAGFLGTKVDPTPNENYTVEGVTADKPTPETDAKAAASATERRTEIAERGPGSEK